MFGELSKSLGGRIKFTANPPEKVTKANIGYKP
jgi:hypothetical protein